MAAERDELARARDLLALSASEQVDTLRLLRGLSVERLAGEAGLSHQTVFDLLKTTKDWRLSTLLKCVCALEADVRIVITPRRHSSQVEVHETR